MADAVLAIQLLHAKPSLMLFQYLHDLFFAKTALLHRLSPCWRTGLLKTQNVSREQVRFNKAISRLL